MKRYAHFPDSKSFWSLNIIQFASSAGTSSNHILLALLITLNDAFLGLGMYGPGPALGKMKVRDRKLGQVVEKNGRAVTVKWSNTQCAVVRLEFLPTEQ